MRPQRPLTRASENSRVPHVLDLIEHRRTRVAWIATAHGFLIAAGLAVVWWATQSSGTQRAEANGWPTGDWPEPQDRSQSGKPTQLPNATAAAPEASVRPKTDQKQAKPSKIDTPSLLTSVERSKDIESDLNETGTDAETKPETQVVATPEPANRSQAAISEEESQTERVTETHPQSAGLDVIPRVVELPQGQGLIEWSGDMSDSNDDALDVATMQPSGFRTEAVRPMGLPPGGIRPISEMTTAFVEWVMPGGTNVDGSQEQESVALTTGQVQFEVPEPDANIAAEIEAGVFTGYLPEETLEAQTSTEPGNGFESMPIAASEEAASAEPQPESGGNPQPTPEPVQAVAQAEPPRPDFNTGSFYGLPAGERTVYLLDASGSLLDTLPFAIEELYRSVRTLDERQSYAVVFFNGDGVIEAAPGRMQPANRTNLTETLTWLEPRLNHVHAKGRPDATNALAHALSLRPDTIILLSDGVTGLRDPAADRRQLVTLLERLGRGVQVHTVQFIDPDPLAARGRLGTLELIASLSGGLHRFVGLDEVAPKPRPKPDF